jgi:hypothetical protein
VNPNDHCDTPAVLVLRVEAIAAIHRNNRHHFLHGLTDLYRRNEGERAPEVKPATSNFGS